MPNAKHQQLGGLTFSLYDAKPQECRLPEPLEHYGRHSWPRVLDGVQHCAPVTEATSTFVWVIYADVDNDCAADGSGGKPEDGYDQLGRGGPGLTMLEPLSHVQRRLLRQIQVTGQLGRLAKGGFGAPGSLFFPEPGAPS